MRESHDILRAVEQTAGLCSVLATLVQVQGSAYRKPGASMLFIENERQVGLIGAGCIEQDLAVRAREMFADSQSFERGLSELIEYDMRPEDDLGWGNGAGCSGIVQVLLEPVSSCLREGLLKTLQHLEGGRFVVSERKLENDGTSNDYRFFAQDGAFFGQGGEGKIEGQEGMLESQGAIRPQSGGVIIRRSGLRVFRKSWQPRPRLYVIGAGPDARPLAAMAAGVGFAVTVIDWRPGLCNERYFPNAALHLQGQHPEDVLRECRISPNDFVVVMTHHFQTDQKWIRMLLKERIRYLGLLGARKRALRLLEGEGIPEQLRTPVGMAIGAEGPEEIAISILADMIRVYRREQ